MLNDAASGRPLRTLVLGGARSGKSTFAEELAGRAEPVRYVATAQVDPADLEFTERIAAHRDRRPANWTLVEGDPVEALADPARVTLIDDLGTWLTGRIDARAAWDSSPGVVAPDVEALVAAIEGYRQRLIVVSPEVGLGVIPATAAGRVFQDEIGTLNQRIAAVCDEVFLVVAGRAIRLDTAAEAGGVAEGSATTGSGSAVAGSGSAVVGPDSAVAGLDSAVTGAQAAVAGPDLTLAGSGSAVTESGSAVAGHGDLGLGSGASGSSASGPVAGEPISPESVTAAMSAAAAGGSGIAAGTGRAENGAAAVPAPVSGAPTIPGAADPIYSESAAPDFGPVTPPDAEVRAQAEARQLQLTKPAGALGRLEPLGNWVAACQGVCPPRQFERARVVVFAGDHGIARYGVSAYPSEVTAQMVANFIGGGAAVNALARLADATVRVVDIAVESDTDPSVSAHKIRRSSGAIDREDALTEAETNAAIAAGRAIADEEIDGGADLLIAGDMGIGNTTPATVLIATLTATEPVVAIGRGTGIDDHGWMRKAAAVRDAMWRARPHKTDPVALLRVAGGADFAAMAGYLAQAAARRTPVVLDGVVVTAAALVAELLAPGAKAWWVAGHRSAEPSHTLALTKLDLKPLVEMDMRLGEGSGAVTAVPLLRAAIAALSEMSTFGDAGVSTADAAS
ncbi:nicotinate-nucleotide--dimethylbenzimidazole phosphoribosyltransferase [Nocardia aurantia]|uniref:Nicotinate-nucleotide--dimethylbenzimidazole phosphoribosyltransferase n=1 Tax=Nocardia aurantia TaxID=2585199 RepID=A0A7K0DIY5_9NOCA|nr:nicotinate-nucleotide--dimethylbenzimidazole phosphoribosyltransferase [Nocardia aurantia]MQY25627.1 Nicotinate-nucleotide--dimethylbenzimidazole phosphoribosyltransferase [Nocardia aurantia]